MNSTSCEFCRLVRKENEATVVFEDDRTMAFMDIKPVNDGHILVISKSHYENIYDAPEDEVASVFKVVKRVAGAIRRGVNPDGLSIAQHNGRAAMQRVFHFHVHVIPRYEGQRFPRPDEVSMADRDRLEEVASKIRKYV